MDEISFSLETEMFPNGQTPAVVTRIGGVTLLELLRAAEGPAARAAGREPAADGLANLRAELGFGWPSRHFLGEPARRAPGWVPDGLTTVLGCACGDDGCSQLAARIDVDQAAGTVTWRDFWIRGLGLLDLGPFRFRLDNYLAALRLTENA